MLSHLSSPTEAEYCLHLNLVTNSAELSNLLLVRMRYMNWRLSTGQCWYSILVHSPYNKWEYDRTRCTSHKIIIPNLVFNFFKYCRRPRTPLIRLSVRPSVCLSVCYKIQCQLTTGSQSALYVIHFSPWHFWYVVKSFHHFDIFVWVTSLPLSNFRASPNFMAFIIYYLLSYKILVLISVNSW